MALNAPPTPTPNCNRPPEIRSTVPTICASNTGWRSAISITAVPSRTRDVRAAMAASVVMASSRGLAVRLSPTHTESRPASSAHVAIFNTDSASVGLSSSSSRPRVGSKQPICTFPGIVTLSLTVATACG